MRHSKHFQNPKPKPPDSAAVIGNISALVNCQHARSRASAEAAAAGPSSARVTRKITMTTTSSSTRAVPECSGLGTTKETKLTKVLEDLPGDPKKPYASLPPARVGGTSKVRCKWTDAGTQQQSFAALESIANNPPPQTLTTVPAPMISYIPPINSNSSNIAGLPHGKQPQASATVDEGSLVHAEPDMSSFPAIQRAKFRFSCEFRDGSLQSKSADQNRVRAEYLMNRFNGNHARKVAFYKKYRNPDPQDADYDAFSAAALGPFDLMRAVTDLDFHNPIDAAFFDSHYAEILTLFTDDSFVTALSVGGDIDRELLRVRSKHILLSGGSALRDGNLSDQAIMSPKGTRANLREEANAMSFRMGRGTKPGDHFDIGGGLAPSSSSPTVPLTPKQRAALELEQTESRAKKALQDLFSRQQRRNSLDDSGESTSSDVECE